ncbi:MAG: hypothetical protein H7331_03955 [Bacteroidia bacterium]|nr:hypothetical protein [Bacteroidia bacterium]
MYDQLNRLVKSLAVGNSITSNSSIAIGNATSYINVFNYYPNGNILKKLRYNGANPCFCKCSNV